MAYKIPNPKETKEKDIFKVPDEEVKSKEEDLFKVDKQDALTEINEDLFAEQIPIEIKNEETLLVKANGRTHEITRKDLLEYQKTQIGSQSGYRQLGTIGGDWRLIDDIVKDVAVVFTKIDEKLETYKTLDIEE